MAVRPLVTYPDPVLRKECAAVEEFAADLASLLDDLRDSMAAHRGLGLAAPQIGQALAACVVDVAGANEPSRLIELVNPCIEWSSEEQSEYEEGCLSFPDEADRVVRPARVTVTACDRAGVEFTVEAEGLLATALQHEMDHLRGVLFIDHLSRLRRSLVDRRMRKRKKRSGG